MLGFDAIGQLALGQLEDTNRILWAETGVFTLTGQPARMVVADTLRAEAGAFVLTGFPTRGRRFRPIYATERSGAGIHAKPRGTPAIKATIRTGSRTHAKVQAIL